MRVYTFDNINDMNEFSDAFGKWLDDVIPNDLPEETVALAFNIYEDKDNFWSCEVIATNAFDAEDVSGDWACCEISHFDTREDKLFAWQQFDEFNVILEKLKYALNQYLENGKKAKIMKETAGVGMGLVDGDLELMYVNQKEN